MTTGAPPNDFRGRFSTDPERLRSHGSAAGPFHVPPRAVATPADEEDLRALVRWAGEADRSLVPRGAATGMPGGNVGGDVAVDLSTPFRWIGPVDRDRRLVRVGSGAVAADVNRRARSENLFLPALPSSADRCTVGGMVSTNAAGARSFAYGAIHRWVHALTLVLADGRLVELTPGAPAPDPLPELLDDLRPRRATLERHWPRVAKNSSGYALDRFLSSGDAVQLLVGSEGTLGLVTGAVLRLAPEPESRGLILLPVREPDVLPELVGVAEDLGAAACEFFGRRFVEIAELDRNPRVAPVADDAYALAMVELDGAPERVAEGLRRLRTFAGSSPTVEARAPDERSSLWDLRHAASPRIARAARRGLVSMQFIEDSVVPRERLPDYLVRLEGILRDAGTDAVIFGHAGDGNVHVNPLVDVRRPEWRARVREILDRTAELVADLGGTLSGEHGDGRVRAPYLSRIWSRAAVRAFREVKERLDPRGLLNPGVILPRPGQDPLEGLGEGLEIP